MGAPLANESEGLCIKAAAQSPHIRFIPVQHLFFFVGKADPMRNPGREGMSEINEPLGSRITCSISVSVSFFEIGQQDTKTSIIQVSTKNNLPNILMRFM